MEVRAKAKFIRMSPRKLRLIVDLIRGSDVGEAVSQLQFMAKAGKRPILKLLDSCVANAVNSFKLKRENLYIKTITVDGGSVLKRWQPRAFGRAAPIRKRSSHILLILAEKIESKKKVEKPKEVLERPKVVETLKVAIKEKAEEKKAGEKTSEKREEPPKKELKKSKAFFKRIFQRKTG